ncbi:MAG: PmoA family protein, partial [Planctomycetaceae bacterium]
MRPMQLLIWGWLTAVLGTAGYSLSAAESSYRVESVQNERGLELRRDGRTVLQYHIAVADPPAGIDPVYRRSGFLHPVATPAGAVVTADFPVDHPHQHGIFSAWVKTSFKGRSVDFWNQAGKTGAVEHVRVIDTTSGPGWAGFQVELQHLDLAASGGSIPVLREVWTLTLQAAGPEHLFDLESRQTCIADTPLTVEEYHYGGIAFRGCDAWFSNDAKQPADFEFITSEGLGRDAGNHSRPNWVAAVGSVSGQRCGLAVLAHPQNFQHPSPVRLHPTKPYFAFSPCVLGAFQFQP